MFFDHLVKLRVINPGADILLQIMMNDRFVPKPCPSGQRFKDNRIEAFAGFLGLLSQSLVQLAGEIADRILVSLKAFHAYIVGI